MTSLAVVGADGGLLVVEDAEAEVGAFLLQFVELVGEVLELGGARKAKWPCGMPRRKRMRNLRS